MWAVGRGQESSRDNGPSGRCLRSRAGASAAESPAGSPEQRGLQGQGGPTRGRRLFVPFAGGSPPSWQFRSARPCLRPGGNPETWTHTPEPRGGLRPFLTLTPPSRVPAPVDGHTDTSRPLPYSPEGPAGPCTRSYVGRHPGVPQQRPEYGRTLKVTLKTCTDGSLSETVLTHLGDATLLGDGPRESVAAHSEEPAAGS